jgi:hypothetical protein
MRSLLTWYSLFLHSDSCRQLEPDVSQDCFVYEATATGSVLGNTQIPDVMVFIELLLEGQALASNYSAAFLGVPVADPGDEAGRDNLGEPSNLNQQEIASNDPGRKTITIVGGLLVTAFCCAFLGIVFVLFRRRRHYLKTRQEMHLTLSKSDLQQYDTEPHISEDGPSSSPEGVQSVDGSDEELFPNNITFDLGTSFKDQLMGVHGLGGGPRRPPHMSGPYGHSVGPYGASVDGASDSDADSWAQTDGTIGSLELQLEPITAEV